MSSSEELPGATKQRTETELERGWRLGARKRSFVYYSPLFRPYPDAIPPLSRPYPRCYPSPIPPLDSPLSRLYPTAILVAF